jgi:hypothetical protein
MDNKFTLMVYSYIYVFNTVLNSGIL